MAHGEALPGSGFWTPVESTGLLTGAKAANMLGAIVGDEALAR